jgi:hypothetical protein
VSYQSQEAAAGMRFLLAVLIGILVAATAIGAAYEFGGGSPSHSPTMVNPPPPGTASCLHPDSLVSDPGAPHGEFVLAPPNGPHNAYYSDVQTYLLHNPVLCGADFWVAWSSVESGSIEQPIFNFSAVDANAAPWIAAGKEVNLLFLSVGSTSQGQDVPSSVLSHVPTLQCGNSTVDPVEWNATFESAYQAFIAATIHHYEGMPGIGYLRFGLGDSGTPTPVSNITAPGCQSQLNNAGFSLSVWTDYLTGMLAYEHSLQSTVPLLISIAPVYPDQGDNVSPTVAAAAVADGIGFGNEGFRASDASTVESDGVGCGGYGWCKQFWRFEGQVPLELQTVAASSPNGTGPVGSLVPLLPFGLSQHAQIFELYLDDWLTAFDPNYPGYALYHAEYATILNQVANVVGEGSS